MGKDSLLYQIKLLLPVSTVLAPSSVPNNSDSLWLFKGREWGLVKSCLARQTFSISSQLHCNVFIRSSDGKLKTRLCHKHKLVVISQKEHFLYLNVVSMYVGQLVIPVVWGNTLFIFIVHMETTQHKRQTKNTAVSSLRLNRTIGISFSQPSPLRTHISESPSTAQLDLQHGIAFPAQKTEPPLERLHLEFTVCIAKGAKNQRRAQTTKYGPKDRWD